MKRNIQFLLFVLLLGYSASAQVYLDQFDEDKMNTSVTDGYVNTIEESELTITGDGSNAPYASFGYVFVDENNTPTTIDITENNKVFIRAKASSIGTQFRIDVKDIDGYVTTIDNVTETLVNDYTVLEFEYTVYQDGGYGGTACDSDDAPCPVDGTQIAELTMFLNPGIPGFAGTAVIDYISVGDVPSTGPQSDVYQDEFNSDSSNDFIAFGDGYEGSVADGLWTITGLGTAGPYNPMEYFFHNMTTLDTADIDLTLGDNKIYVRVKGNVDGIALRCDVQDIDGFITTLGSVTKIISAEYATYEYDLTGLYQDLGYGGTPCDADTAPCDVDPTRARNLTFFVTPGVEGFSGELQIEYISIGTPLEAVDPGLSEVTYGDHFNDGNQFANAEGPFVLNEIDSELTIVGDGTAPPYSAIAYSPHDMETLTPIVLDVTLNNKIYVKGRTSTGNTLLRMDLIDTAGFVTSMPSLTKVLIGDDNVLEYDFTGLYIDAGYGGTACDSGPCDVDATAISGILLYTNPDDGAFDGVVTLDYISVGAPLGEDIAPYSDQFDNEINFLGDATGFTSSEENDELLISGDGTSGAYAAMSYITHDMDSGNPLIIDMTFNNKLYVKAKSDVEGAPLRIDLLDSDGYASNAQAQINTLTSEYVVYEYDYTGAYLDGGYGGTPCTADDAPCEVNGSSISSLLLYIDPDNGGFDGNVTIDWISTQNPLETIGDPGPKGIADYNDQFLNNVIDNISGNIGLEVSEADGILTITGDGSSEMWNPIVYTTHDQDDESAVLVDAVINNNLVIVRARASSDSILLRMDLQDNQGYVTSQAGITRAIETEFNTYTYDYTNNYIDGGYGGTACETGPCDVDGERVNAIQLFIKPGVGQFSGTLDIDWISFGEALVDNVVNTDLVNQALIYPNPSTGNFVVSVDLNASVSDMNISIYDLAGQLVYGHSNKLQGDSFETEINIENLLSGAYILTGSSNGKILFNQKLMIR